jgi:hypothetical protein
MYGERQKREREEARYRMRYESTLKVIEIVALAKYNMSIGHSIAYNFAELLKECTKLYIILNWQDWKEDRPYTEEEILAANEGTEEEKELYGLTEDEVEEDRLYCENMQPKIKRFIEIIESDPSTITEEAQKEAFELAPIVIQEIGGLY